MKIIERQLNDIVVLKPNVFEDHRGFFVETYKKNIFSDLGIDFDFVQDNHSRSSKGVLRGLHFQWEPPMGKLMRVTLGSCFLVAVDVRYNSSTLGQWYGVEVSAENKLQVWAPYGFARGFCVLSDWAEIQYKCTGTYNKNAENGIRWNDPEVGIKWPIENPILSDRDVNALTLSEWLSKDESKYLKV